MKIYLNVPFSEKDEAKALGARWDASARKWYAPNGERILVDRWPFNGNDLHKEEFAFELSDIPTEFMKSFPKYRFKFSGKSLSFWTLLPLIIGMALYYLVNKMFSVGFVTKDPGVKIKQKIATQVNISASISVQKKIKSVEKKPKQEKTDILSKKNKVEKPKKLPVQKIEPELKDMIKFIKSRKVHSL